MLGQRRERLGFLGFGFVFCKNIDIVLDGGGLVIGLEDGIDQQSR